MLHLLDPPSPPQFLVLALPRSRTAWTSHYLAYGNTLVGHDIAPFCRSVSDFAEVFARLRGSVETGAVVGWRVFVELFPSAKLALIRRPVEEVRRSLAQFGVEAVPGELEARDAMLDEVALVAGAPSFEFRDLYLPGCRKRLFEHCLDAPWDPAWDAALAPVNIQIDVRERLAWLAHHQPSITGLKQEVSMWRT